MKTRIVSLMVGVGIVAGSLTGCAAKSPPVSQPPLPAQKEDEALLRLADRVCLGDKNAMPELTTEANKLYQGVDLVSNNQRARDNFVMLTAAFERIGRGAGQSNLAALSALQESAAGTTQASGFATNALGTAAAAGSSKALDMLLHHDQFGIVASSAVSALGRPAAAGSAEATAYLMGVLDDQQKRALWNLAAEGLRKPAAGGNASAAKALELYDAQLQKQRNRAN